MSLCVTVSLFVFVFVFCVYACVFVCVCRSVSAFKSVLVFKSVFMPVSEFVSVCTSVPLFVLVSACLCPRACVRVLVSACLCPRACVRVLASACLCPRACVRVLIFICVDYDAPYNGLVLNIFLHPALGRAETLWRHLRAGLSHSQGKSKRLNYVIHSMSCCFSRSRNFPLASVTFKKSNLGYLLRGHVNACVAMVLGFCYFSVVDALKKVRSF